MTRQLRKLPFDGLAGILGCELLVFVEQFAGRNLATLLHREVVLQKHVDAGSLQATDSHFFTPELVVGVKRFPMFCI